MTNNNNNNNNDIPLLTTPFLQYNIPSDSNELDFHLPSRTPLHGLTVAEWAGTKLKNHNSTITSAPTKEDTKTVPFHNKSNTTSKDTSDDNNWKDVYRNIKCMDQLYDASFYSWLKSEENVLVTAMYLHRIANEYPLVRIVNALKWLISDWRLESISTLVRYVTADWCDEVGNWATQYTTTLITMVLSSAPYASATHAQRESFLRVFTKDWDFSKLSEFFMYLTSPANIDYKVKCVMLQEAARREREALGAKLCKKTQQQNDRRHHRRTSSNDVNDIKRLRLSTPDLEHAEQESTDHCASMLHSRSVTSSPPPSLSANANGNNEGTTTVSSPSTVHGNNCTSGSSNHNIHNNNNDNSGSSNSNHDLVDSSNHSSNDNHSNSHNLASSSSSNQDHHEQRDVFLYPSSLHGLSHLRRRSSSIGSIESCDIIEDPMDAASETTMKRRNAATSSSTHVSFFTE
ncbi:hypothetical protein G6F57_008825 [Rhizopus arrhizus]|uniref:Uncharacterized protein n=1 Tax=Rhizopus oryzae TaxID=64495 RepID=A0A9P6X5N7_RHIOR|nr:hypothetical protein G6F23_004349 [Rhizopus arrhizus]KAG1421250.1 hypothetical protein G6F58_003823 [Rhizopus delemar]KAG0759585.1 hypothetical protein G6F24_008952 [Rhizopus arrhizus]KAG0784676.1 hypothetical protein G6F22_008224 [Rhizopus arrhizus]KAG0793539.1 hypothetical protein G6F21_003537 [Rhizopus arrhizus]